MGARSREGEIDARIYRVKTFLLQPISFPRRPAQPPTIDPLQHLNSTFQCAQPLLCLMLLAAFPAAAHTAAAALPFHFIFFLVPPLFVLLATPTASQPSLLTRDIKLLGENCALVNWGEIWTYKGNTADGRPFYHNEGRGDLG